MTKKEAIQQIKDIDEQLGLLRTAWLEGGDKKKKQLSRLIDKSLDERGVAMKIRDGK